MALTREVIISASLGILDEFGLADVTMRRVASVLGVKAGALYWHFGNKQSLLAAVSDQILCGLTVPLAEATIERWLASWAAALRDLLLQHHDAAELVASVTAMDLGCVDPCLEGRLLLEERGMDFQHADATMRAWLHFVLGHVMEEQTRSQLVRLGVAAAFDAGRAADQFRHGVELLRIGTRSLMS